MLIYYTVYISEIMTMYILHISLLWIKTRVMICQDMERTRQVYTACLDILPHKKFTFAKIWIMLAHFEVRQKNLQAARKTMV